MNALLTVVYLKNRIPSPLFSQQTPFERLWHRKPAYSHLRAFECLCYDSTLDCHRSKFSPRSTPGVFIGYPPGYKGYKLLDLINNAIFISRDVVFREGIFPFKSNPITSPYADFFMIELFPLIHLLTYSLLLIQYPLSILLKIQELLLPIILVIPLKGPLTCMIITVTLFLHPHLHHVLLILFQKCLVIKNIHLPTSILFAIFPPMSNP